MELEAVIGLEVHAQLNTKTKIFCGCPTSFGSESNTQICPVCTGMPGVLPVLNREVLHKSILAGLALNCKISEYSVFDRKNYFYPDLPKAYQISQFDKPICIGGVVPIVADGVKRDIQLTRIHMEEDAGKNIHSDDISNPVSYVDYNRTGVPLMEIVSEPDMHTGEEAYQYLSNLRKILRYINVSDCNMEEGSFRCDVNISLRPKGETKLGEKVEVKNMNSFKAVKAAIEYEIKRQTIMIEDKERIKQETRLWNPDKSITESMRSKEEAHDYRYFPDPDLAPITVTQDQIKKIREELPELPVQKLERFKKEYALPDLDAETLCASRSLADYFESVVKSGHDAKKAANWIANELLSFVENIESMDSFKVTPEMMSEMLSLIDKSVISGKIAKKVLSLMIETGKTASRIVEDEGLKQVTDTGAIEAMVDDVLKANPEIVEEIRNGKDKAKGFLVGQIMKAAKGKANPQLVNEILAKKLS
ncbi:MAG TPA: Asp-tRNA(Asn)/Glu-tRNA(Gln) amidotransferase subunit GatB [Spirochaetota bacterium]|nr:Asp-tRNA(Asn)/Glu-tRNA(Gln) amidotransferase subunit GatB [Spirochaetota bacterium]